MLDHNWAVCTDSFLHCTPTWGFLWALNWGQPLIDSLYFNWGELPPLSLPLSLEFPSFFFFFFCCLNFLLVFPVWKPVDRTKKNRYLCHIGSRAQWPRARVSVPETVMSESRARLCSLVYVTRPHWYGRWILSGLKRSLGREHLYVCQNPSGVGGGMGRRVSLRKRGGQ